ncbi:MAG: hypothetical protein MUD12_17270 [Spirochaetes bacterium]|jgi:hypothetical protein|nr:hypothetical protein [Spirochaetota bacterium]
MKPSECHFNGMAIEPNKLKSKIDDIFEKIFKHFIKLKLIDPSWGDAMHKGISNFAKQFQNRWEKDIIIQTCFLFEKLNNYSIKKGYREKKEDIYIESLMDAGIDIHEVIVKEAINQHPQIDEIDCKVLQYVKNHGYTGKNYKWYNSITGFYLSEGIKPDKNTVVPPDDAIKRLQEFIIVFMNL